MKEIKFEGRRYLYEVHTHNEFYCTHFYHPEPRPARWWERVFGTTHGGLVYDLVFTLGINIEDPRHTKSYVRECMRKEVELLDRAEEIRRGEII